MYKNVGKKIMVLAQACGWICLIGGGIAAISFFGEDEPVAGWISLAVAAIGFISSWPLYGFGQMVDDVNAIRGQASGASAQPADELPEL